MKGNNLRIEETKQELTSFINEKLQELPIGVIRLILETTMVEINDLYSKVVEKESSEYEEGLKNEQNQNGSEDSKED